MIKLTAEEIKLAEQFLITVMKREPHVEYKELGDRVKPPIHHRQVPRHIGEISKLCHELGLPFLSAKVISKGKDVAGIGFYHLYTEYFPDAKKLTPKQVFREECKKIRECTEWYKLADYLHIDIDLPRPTIKNNNDIKIRFEDEHRYIKDTTYSNFLRGVIKNPYDKTVCGVACTGEGIHEISLETNKSTIKYKTWHNMIGRCFLPKWQKQQKTYVDCTVCDEWLNYQNFGDWYDANWYETEGERLCLDKDLLHKNNKIYSPENCVFLPARVNLLLINRKNYRGGSLLGVVPSKNGTFSARSVDISEKPVRLGTYYTEIEAFNAYKTFRENVFKEVAEIYKGIIPNKAYEALLHRKIDITD
jgi:hypothetical protein